MTRKHFALMALIFGSLAIGIAFAQSGVGGAEAAKDPAVERARREVRLLDDLYKTAVVLITKHYVNENTDLAAGPAAKALFAAMKEKGWHEVRLLDVSGEPLMNGNVAKDEFEKEAVKRLKANEPYYDQVIEQDGMRYLRAATPIPVVMDKCVMCHENYRGNKGVIGSLAYKLPIE